MKSWSVLFLVLLASALARAAEVRDQNTPRSFPEIKSRAQWEERARTIREHILVNCGLWPMPAKTPLNARVFDRVEREGYSIEKVAIETWPGFFLAGNLYRPLGKGTGPFPAVLNPHGHWENGRMADSETGSIAARCINFARQGMVAFSYDMVGYNDTRQVDHRFASHPTNQLWSISLMGLQTWNTIRALDFLESLGVVDAERLACTGESGGGTQTFMLGAIDDRLAVQAPVVMVSHSMQGGCLCENVPGLRISYSNVEIAAVPAPRPQILVAATGDWTRKTMEMEGPAMEGIYKLFDAAERFEFTIFDYPHNYNRESREAVYAWFGKWLLPDLPAAELKEKPYKKEPDAELRVFPDKMPESALNERQLIDSFIAHARKQLADLRPKDTASLEKWKQVISPLWRHTLELQETHQSAGPPDFGSGESNVPREFSIPRNYGQERIAGLISRPMGGAADFVTVLAHPEGKEILKRAAGDQGSLAGTLVARGIPVVAADWFLTGGAASKDLEQKRDQFARYFTTHNRTDLQERIADIRAVIGAVREAFPGKKVLLVGEEAGGLWAALAAPLADAVIADCAQLDASNAEKLLDRAYFFPGFYRLDGFAGALALAAPNPVFLHNVHEGLETGWLNELYAKLPNDPKFTAHAERKPPAELVAWVAENLR